MEISRSRRSIERLVVIGIMLPSCVMVVYCLWGHLFAFSAYSGLENGVNICN